MKFNKYDYETISSNSQNKPISTPPWPREEQNNQHTSELNNSFKARPKQPSHLAMQFHLQVNTIKTTHNYKFITQEKLQITDQK